MKVFTAQQMRDFDKAATEQYGIPSIVLMENAALRVVEFLEMKFAPLKDKRIVVLCGKGNNGGDGFAIARHLLNINRSLPDVPIQNLTIVLAAAPGEYKGDALCNYEMINRAIGDISHIYLFQIPEIGSEDDICFLDQIVRDADVVIDALIGTGFTGEIRGNRLKKAISGLSGAETRVAVDIASGLNSDTGAGASYTLAAWSDYTITFAAPKRGMFLRDGLSKSGEIWVGSMGTPISQMEETNTGCECITREKASALLPCRPPDAHKGDAGRVLLIGGSYGMSGAPTLAAKAVLKSGAGTCIAALPDKVLPIFAGAFAEATSHALPCDENGALIESAADDLPKLWENAHAVALGPGIGREESTLAFVRRVVKECPQPLIIDADALYALRAIEADLKNREAPTILTPHPGEMGELMEMSTQDVQDSRIETAIACSQKFNAIVVLKGARSIVALPNGNTHINLTGNSAMATGGSGDVLTGTIAGLLAQTKNAQTATLLGVYLHGLAGDLAYEEKGNGLIAGDIAENLPRALLELSKPIEPPINARLRKLE